MKRDDMLLSYLFVFFAGALFVLATCLFFIRFAHRAGLLDHADSRKQHVGAIPLVGGLIFFSALGLSFSLLEVPEKFEAIAGFLAIIFVMGLFDDRFGLPASLRLCVQVAVTSLAFFYAEVQLNEVGPLFWQSLPMGLLGLPISVLFVVIFVNSFNMIDGLDGLAIGQAFISFAALMCAQYLYGDIPHASWFVLVLGVLTALFVINTSAWAVVKIFLGDSGSTVIGFLLGWLIVDLSQVPGRTLHPVSALWCVAFPLFDFFATLIRRFKLRANFFAGDRNHLHHWLTESGVPQSRVVPLLLCGSASASAAGILVTQFLGAEAGLAVLLAAFILFVYGTVDQRRLSTICDASVKNPSVRTQGDRDEEV